MHKDMAKRKVIDVYHEVMRRASEFEGKGVSNSEKNVFGAIARELYWAASMLEDTEEVNPTEDKK